MKKKNLKDKLNRFNSHINSPKEQKQKIDQKIPDRYQKMADELNGKLVSNFAGSYCRVDRLYPEKYKHGKKTLPVSGIPSVSQDAFTIEESGLDIPIDKLLFFDIETTGLGGSGAVPFLVGFGSVNKQGFEVRQYLLADYPDETAMLEDILSELSESMILVSYNGASFDLPFVRDRMIINRVAREIMLAGHIDLLHVTRRFFKRRLKDCTLTNIERELFNFYRQDDIPGYLVPSVYFEWLSSESLDLMHGVLEHNRLDIVSLYFLMFEIFEIHASDGDILQDVDDLHSLSRLYNRRKNLDGVQNVFKKIDNLSGENIEKDILLFHSLAFKKTKDFQQAVPLWERLAGSTGKEAFISQIELAKYYEHQKKDFKKALQYALFARKSIPGGETQKRDLSHRISRLQAKSKG